LGITETLTETVGGYSRTKRWRLLLDRFPDLAEMRVLDIGGTVRGWKNSPVTPGQVVMINMGKVVGLEDDVPWARRIVGDACRPSAALASERFDLVYCNSVIEHVGGHDRRIALADTIHSLAEHHWVQTPYRYFPVEPHIMAPGAQFLPLWMRAELLRRWPIGRMRNTCADWPETRIGSVTHPVPGRVPLGAVPRHYAIGGVLSIELLTRTELQWLFPRSTIVAERLAGVTKSIIAVA
jgi:hypothetical protein